MVTPAPPGESDALFSGHLEGDIVIDLHLKGRTAPQAIAAAQTIFSAFSPGAIASLWLGLRGPRQTLTLIAGRDPGRSPHYWFGPDLPPGRDFDIHVAFYPDMGPGGVLYRLHSDPRWTSFDAATATGIERLAWPRRWSVGQGQGGEKDRPFRRMELNAAISNSSEPRSV